MDENVGMEEINPFWSPALLAAQAEVLVRDERGAKDERQGKGQTGRFQLCYTLS